MLNIQLVAIVVRLFAVSLVTYALRNLPAFWIFNQPEVTLEQRLYTVGFSILMLMVAIGLWLFPFTAAKKLVPDQSASEYPTLSEEQLQRTATSLLGLWTLIDAVPNGGYAVVALSMRSAPLDGAVYSTIARIIVEVAIGIWLLFGAKGLWRHLNKRRSISHEKSV